MKLCACLSLYGRQKEDRDASTQAAVFGVGAFVGAAVVFLGSKLIESFWGEEEPQSQAPLRANNNVSAGRTRAENLTKCDAEDAYDGDDAPTSFLCPITQEPMRDPVVTCYGHCFERTAIERWISERGTCPLTKRPLSADRIYPCYSMRAAIEEMSRREADWKLRLQTSEAQSAKGKQVVADVSATVRERSASGDPAAAARHAFDAVGCGASSRYEVRLESPLLEWCDGEALWRSDSTTSYPAHSAYVLLPRLASSGLLGALSTALPLARSVSVVGSFSAANEGSEAVELVSRDRDANGVIAGVVTLEPRTRRVFAFGDTGLWCVEVRSLSRAPSSVRVAFGNVAMEGGSVSDDGLGMC